MKRFPNPERITPLEFEITVKRWFEKLGESLESIEVNHLETIAGGDGEFAFDVTIRFTAFGGAKYLTVCECKKHKNPIKREVIQILHDKMRSVGAQKGFVISTAPFQKGAQEYAKKHGIALMTIVSGSVAYVQSSGRPMMPYIPDDADDFVGMFQCKSEIGAFLDVIVSSKSPYWLKEFMKFPKGTEYQLEDRPSQEAEARWMKSLGQYIGCLGITYVHVNSNGDGVGTPMTYTCSGFFIILDGKWYFVTAGHVFKNDKAQGLEQLIGRNAIHIESACIFDYFGKDANDTHSPTVISYDAVLEKTVYLNEDDFGLDFAFLPLQDEDAKAIMGKDAKAFVEFNWQFEGRAEQYRIIGFPEEEKLPASCTDTEITSYVRPISVAAEPCTLPVGIPEPKYPYFAGRLLSSSPIDAVGLSGSPIMALNSVAGEGSHGYLVGIDVAWYPTSRIVIGCQMNYVIKVFRKLRDLRDAK